MTSKDRVKQTDRTFASEVNKQPKVKNNIYLISETLYYRITLRNKFHSVNELPLIERLTSLITLMICFCHQTRFAICITYIMKWILLEYKTIGIFRFYN